MNVKYFGNLVLLLIFCSFKSFGQDYEQLLEKLEKQTFDYVQEKVYLHLDKPYYAPGDDLWFKAYTVAGPNHSPTPLSQNLYVELINAQKQVVARHTIYMQKGLGHGDFKLADSLNAGVYTMRAYTNWMRNFDQAFFYTRQIMLLESGTEQATVPGTGKQIAPTLRFFPEGGDLVANVPGQVALEVNSGEFKGVIKDDTGAEVVRFESNKAGLGKFGLTPTAGRTYVATLEGNGQEYPLPPVKQEGMVLTADNLRDAEQLWITVKTASRQPQHEAFLVLHTRGLVSFGSRLSWKGAFARLKVPKANIAPGVVHITLFNTDWKPIAERLVYKRLDADMIDLDLASDQSEYGFREPTRLNIKLTDKEGKPLKGFFSMSVLDSKQISNASINEDIRSVLMLTSDVNGHVVNPLQYFQGANDKTDQQLDLLMLTKGWRRFVWQDLFKDQFPETPHVVEQGFQVTGMVTQGANSKKKVSNGKIKQVGMFNGLPNLAEAKTDGSGRFELKNLYYYGNEGLIRATGKKDRSNVNIRLDSREPVPNYALGDLSYSAVDVEETADFVQRSQERKQISLAYDIDTTVTDLGTVVIEADANEQKFRDRQRGLVFNQGQYGFNVTDMMAKGTRPMNALYMLQGRIPGLTITPNTSGEPIVSMTRDSYTIVNSATPVMFFLDDSPSDIIAITAMPPEMIERVEVLKGNRAMAVLGEYAAGGAVFFYTKTGADWERYYAKMLENNIIVDRSTKALPEGYYRSRQFYKPVYDPENPTPKPDYRDLIHWEPMIETDENGVATIEYFNADLPTTIQVRLEGLWEGGIPLVKLMEYRVKD